MDFARDAVVFARDALAERRAHSNRPSVPVLIVIVELGALACASYAATQRARGARRAS